MLRLELVEVNRSLVRKNAGRSVKFRSDDEKARVRNVVLYDDCEVSKTSLSLDIFYRIEETRRLMGCCGGCGVSVMDRDGGDY